MSKDMAPDHLNVFILNYYGKRATEKYGCNITANMRTHLRLGETKKFMQLMKDDACASGGTSIPSGFVKPSAYALGLAPVAEKKKVLATA